MCSKCIHKITFLFRMMGFGRACKVCEKEYMKQNERKSLLRLATSL